MVTAFAPHFRRTRLGLGATLAALLAACNSGNPNAPSLNQSLSYPANLEIFTTAGSSSSGNYVHFDYASSEHVAYNSDSLAGVSIDGSAATGALSVAPGLTQIPGIYYLTIDAQNTNGTSAATVVVNVAPPPNATLTASSTSNDVAYTVVDFPMYGNKAQRNTNVAIFQARNRFINGSDFAIMQPPAGGSPANTASTASADSEGIFINSITGTANTNSSTYSVSADITVNTEAYGMPPTQTVYFNSTSSAGITTTTSVDCVPLQFQVYPSSNTFTLTPYVENICLRIIP